MKEIHDRYLSPQTVMKNRFKNHRKPNWKAAILCFRDSAGCDVLVKKFNAVPVAGYKIFYGIDAQETERQVFEADINDMKICIITRLSWGGPQAAILVEELSYLGVEYIIGYGAAGSINANIRKGDRVIGVQALLSDGTSRSYIDDQMDIGCSDELLKMVMQIVEEGKIDVKVCCVANIDALYRETKELIRKYQDQGAVIVNLETAALFAASELCKVKSIWLGFISDSLVGDEWDDWNWSDEQLSEVCSDICMKLIAAISQTYTISERTLIRPFIHKKDLDYVMEAHSRIYNLEYDFDDSFNSFIQESISSFVDNRYSEHENLWVLEIDGQLRGSIGVVKASKGTAQIRWFLVEPEYRRRGLGKQLLEKAIEFCKEHGYKRVILWTNSSLLAARKLYESHQFTLIESRKQFLSNQEINEERWELDLNEEFDIFNEQMQFIGKASRQEAHAQGLWHQTFHCWVIHKSSMGEWGILLQLRSQDKDSFPGLLDISCAGHLVSGEQVEDGLRELEEELGLVATFDELVPCGIYAEEDYIAETFIDREFCHVFIYRCDKPLTEYRFQKSEISGLYLFKLDEFIQLVYGERDSASAEGIAVDPQMEGEIRAVNREVSRTDLVPHSKAYYELIFQKIHQITI